MSSIARAPKLKKGRCADTGDQWMHATLYVARGCSRNTRPLIGGCQSRLALFVILACSDAHSFNTTSTSSTIVTSTSTVSTYTTGDGCPAIRSCRSHTNCSICIGSIVSAVRIASRSQERVLTLAETKQAQLRFMGALLQTPQCQAIEIPVTLFFDVLAEAVSNNPCTEQIGVVLGLCPPQVYVCYAHDTCQRCLRALYGAHSGSAIMMHDTADILHSPECQALSLHGKFGFLADTPIIAQLVSRCEIFPSCTAFKQYCNQSALCLGCAELLRTDPGRAAAMCPPGSDGWILDGIVLFCSALGLQSAQQFWESRCTASQGMNCIPCLSAISSVSHDIQAAATAWTSPSCERVRSWPLLSSWASGTSPCPRAFVSCNFVHGDVCAQCILNHSTTLGCSTLLNEFNIHSTCVTCPTSIQTTNDIALLTSGIGTLSVLACLWTCFTLIALRRTRTVRDRILFGLFLANMVYSVSNTIPLGLLENIAGHCGELVLPLSTIRSGRAIWFGGKYCLIGYEFFIIFASRVVLQSRSHTISQRLEVALHCCAIFLGAAAFAAFYVKCREINRSGYNDARLNEALRGGTDSHYNMDDDLDDAPERQANSKEVFLAQRDNFDRLIQWMLQVWNCLLAVVVILWVHMRWVHCRVDMQWRAADVEEVAAEETDEWVSTRRSAWTIRRRARLAQRRNYMDIGKPLVPYLVIFLIFAVPAVVMSTNQCQRNSAAHLQGQFQSSSTERSAAHFGLCDVICECVLACRSLATVAVYVIGMKRRREFFNVCRTFRQLYSRLFVGKHDDPHGGNGQSDSCELPLLGSPWQIDPSAATFEEEIGEGGFGTVWRGRWMDNPVAIKVLKLQMIDDEGDIVDSQFKAEFDKESSALHNLDHPNIVKFYGCGMTAEGKAFLLTEYLPGGSLRSVLDDAIREIQWGWRYSIALQVALAFEYLHKIPMLHRDLKADNVLLDATLTRAVVCDLGTATWIQPPKKEVDEWPFTGAVVEVEENSFGLTPTLSTQPPGDEQPGSTNEPFRLCNAERNMTKAIGTQMWMAPETFRGDQSYGLKVDVYAYGMLLYEIATRKIPWTEFLNFDGAGRFRAINEALQAGERPSIPTAVEEAGGRDMVRMMRQCWAGDPVERPEFASIVPGVAECLRRVTRVIPPTKALL